MYQPEPACGPYITTLASVSVSYGSALHTVIALSYGNPSLPEFITGSIRADVSMVSGWGWKGLAVLEMVCEESSLRAMCNRGKDLRQWSLGT